MRYLIAIFCPPLAILLCGKVFTAIASGVLWFFCLPTLFIGVGAVGWLVLMAHAWIVISNHKAVVSRARTGRLAIALLCLSSTCYGAELTREKAERYVEAERLATAQQVEMYQEALLGSPRGSKNYKDDARVVHDLKAGKRFFAPTLTSKSVGAIGAVSYPDERGLAITGRHREMLRLDTHFEAFGGSVIEGYGEFYLRNYSAKGVSGARYRMPGKVYEVVGAAEDGLPILEPFDADAARKMVKRKP